MLAGSFIRHVKTHREKSPAKLRLMARKKIEFKSGSLPRKDILYIQCSCMDPIVTCRCSEMISCHCMGHACWQCHALAMFLSSNAFSIEDNGTDQCHVWPPPFHPVTTALAHTVHQPCRHRCQVSRRRMGIRSTPVTCGSQIILSVNQMATAWASRGI